MGAVGRVECDAITPVKMVESTVYGIKRPAQAVFADIVTACNLVVSHQLQMVPLTRCRR